MTLKRNTFETKNRLTSKGFDPNSDTKWTDLPKYSPIEDLVFLQSTSLTDLIEVIKVLLYTWPENDLLDSLIVL